jgi:hypothetical protein
MGLFGQRCAVGEGPKIEMARAAVRDFKLSADVLAFDTTHFDTHIATTTAGEWARRAHAKSQSKRPGGFGSSGERDGACSVAPPAPIQATDRTNRCWVPASWLWESSTALGDAGPRRWRTLVRNGSSWSEPLEPDLDGEGYSTLISLPWSHGAAELAFKHAARRGAMKKVGGKLRDVRAARLRTRVGELDRTLVVVESQELLRGPKRGIAAALRKAQGELRQLEQRAVQGRIQREALQSRVRKALQRERLSEFIVVTVESAAGKYHFNGTWMWRDGDCWNVRVWVVRCYPPNRHIWSTGRIMHRLQRAMECGGIVPPAKEVGVVPWGPFASVGRQLVTAAQVRHRGRLGIDEPGSHSAGHEEVGAGS